MKENKRTVPVASHASEGGGKFIKGATILAVAGIVGKLLGAVFRIPLTNLIGPVGMSYYGVAYSVYSFFLIVATAGLPVAISRMVSERIALGDYKNAHKAYRVSIWVMTVLGTAGFAICFFGAGALARAMGNPGAEMSLKAVSPVLLLSPLLSSFRGYFQGEQNMMPTAVSEVVEQLFRVIAGLSLSFFLFSRGLKLASAGATFGASAGAAVALILMIFVYVKTGNRRHELIRNCDTEYETGKSMFVEMMNIAIPITIGSTILPIMMLIDTVIIMNRLQATGWSAHMSKTLFGLISGFCDPLIGFPQVFTIAVATSLVPAVTEAFTKKNEENLHKNIRLGIKVMMIVSFPCMIGLIVLAKPILFMLYPYQKAGAALATGTLRILAIGVVGLSILRTFSSALQGVGKMVIPVVNLAIGAVAKVIITYIFVGIPIFNVKGAALGNVVAYFTAAYLNYRAVRKYTQTKIDFRDTFLKPFIAAAIMGGAALAVYFGASKAVSNGVATLIAILIAMIVYFVTVLLMKCIDKEELSKLPKGKKVVRIAERLKLM